MNDKDDLIMKLLDGLIGVIIEQDWNGAERYWKTPERLFDDAVMLVGKKHRNELIDTLNKHKLVDISILNKQKGNNNE